MCRIRSSGRRGGRRAGPGRDEEDKDKGEESGEDEVVSIVIQCGRDRTKRPAGMRDRFGGLALHLLLSLSLTVWLSREVAGSKSVSTLRTKVPINR